MNSGQFSQRAFCRAPTWQIAQRVETEELGDDGTSGLTLTQDARRVVPSNVCSLPDRGVLAVCQDDVVTLTVLDVPVAVEHVPVGRVVNGGVGRHLVLGKPGLKELHDRHGSDTGSSHRTDVTLRQGSKDAAMVPFLPSV